MYTATCERIHVDHATAKRLGHWTEAGHVEVRARKGSVLLDLRSPGLPEELTVAVDLQRTVLTLLLPEDAVVENWDLRWTGKGRLKDGQAPTEAGGRTVRLVGAAEHGEIRIHRGGVAVVTAMLSREYLADLRAAHREGRLPVIDDPARG